MAEEGGAWQGWKCSRRAKAAWEDMLHFWLPSCWWFSYLRWPLRVKIMNKNEKPSRAAKGKGLAGVKVKPQKNENGVVLLSGGNPQIAKGDGDAPVQAYIAAMPGWKSDLGRRLDMLIVSSVPNVQKAVRWNSPFYGVQGRGWFLGIHCLTKYVKVTFFQGMSLRPIPPGGTEKSKNARWIDLYEGEFDEEQMKVWVKQAAALPGWEP